MAAVNSPVSFLGLSGPIAGEINPLHNYFSKELMPTHNPLPNITSDFVQ